VPNEISALGRREEAQRRRDQVADLIERPRAGGPEEGLQFGEGELDRIEVRTIRRQKAELRADGFNRDTDLGLFVDDEIIEDDDIARAQRRDQDLFDVGEEAGIVDRPVEHRGRAEAVEAERGHHGVGFPMTARRVIAEPHAAWTAAVTPQQVGRHPTFVEEHILPPVPQRLPGSPLPPGRRNIRAALLVGVYRFF
jgi:hypothetical protein